MQVIGDTCEFELAAPKWRNGPADCRALGLSTSTCHNEIASRGKVVPSALAPDVADGDGHWAESIKQQQHFIVKLRFQIAFLPRPSKKSVDGAKWRVSSYQNNRFAILIAINLAKRVPQLHQQVSIEESLTLSMIHSDAGDRAPPVEGELSRKWCFNVHLASRCSQFHANDACL